MLMVAPWFRCGLMFGEWLPKRRSRVTLQPSCR